MTWLRKRSIGFEMNTIDEVITLGSYGTAAPTISTTQKKTGANSMRTAGDSRPAGVTFNPAATLMRASFHLHHNGVSSTASREAILVAFNISPTFTGILWNGNTNYLHIYVGGSSVASVNAATLPINSTLTWVHIGVVYKADATVGYISLYIEGEKVLTYVGNTGTGIPGIYLGGRYSAFAGWNSYAYFDDLLVEEDTGGTELDEPPPSEQMLWILVNANASPNEFTVSPSGSNYQAVDDTTPDGDTTYIYADTAGLQERFTLPTPTVPDGYRIVGVSLTALTKRTNTGVASSLTLILDQATDAVGSAQIPASSYLPIQEHFLTQADGSAWTEAAVNSAKWGFDSSGTF